jgi:NAD-dependent deacetylase
MNMEDKIKQAAQLIRNSKYTTGFTGAGISVESGIPPFRGKNGLWNKYDPKCLDISYFMKKPKEAWVIIDEIFYNFFGKAKPNAAHLFLAKLEQYNLLHAVITQNIDNLHQEAGSKTVYEFHGTAQNLVCLKCHQKIHSSKVDLSKLPPVCPNCKGLLKPDFIFFGEGIPTLAYTNSMEEAKNAELFIIIGTTGEVMPASSIPSYAKRNKAKIIEINTEPSNYTNSLTDIFLQGKAGEITKLLDKEIFSS